MSAARILSISRELTVQEELAMLSGKELLAASLETSPRYDGLVLAQALQAVMRRARCKSRSELARQMGVKKSTVYRWSRSKPTTHNLFERALREFAFFLAERQ